MAVRCVGQHRTADVQIGLSIAKLTRWSIVFAATIKNLGRLLWEIYLATWIRYRPTSSPLSFPPWACSNEYSVWPLVPMNLRNLPQDPLGEQKDTEIRLKCMVRNKEGWRWEDVVPTTLQPVGQRIMHQLTVLYSSCYLLVVDGSL